jgi:hypothetical protein
VVQGTWVIEARPPRHVDRIGLYGMYSQLLFEVRDSDDSAIRPESAERAPAPCPICGAPMRIVEILAPRPHDTS